MALIKCTACGHMISDKATKCPKCGCPTTKRSEPHIPQETPQVQPVYYEDDEGGSSRKWLYGIIALLVALIAGGGYWWYNQSGEEREVKEFVSKFAKAVSTKDKMIIAQMYPDASKIDALGISYHADSVVVDHSEGNDTITVNMSASQSLRLMKNDSRNLFVVSSKGLFLCPADKAEIARKTGWLNPKLDDVANTERLKDNGFMPWLNKKAVEVMKANVKVVKSSLRMGEELSSMGTTEERAVNYSVVVENKNNCDIAGNAYIVKVEEKGFYFTWWPDEETKEPYTEPCNRLTGKAIPSNGTVTYSWVGSCVGGVHSGNRPQKLVSKVILNISEQEAIAAYEPNGTEYEEYLESKNIK